MKLVILKRFVIRTIGALFIFACGSLFHFQGYGWYSFGLWVGSLAADTKPLIRLWHVHRYRRYLAKQKRSEFGPYRDGRTVYQRIEWKEGRHQ